MVLGPEGGGPSERHRRVKGHGTLFVTPFSVTSFVTDWIDGHPAFIRGQTTDRDACISITLLPNASFIANRTGCGAITSPSRGQKHSCSVNLSQSQPCYRHWSESDPASTAISTITPCLLSRRVSHLILSRHRHPSNVALSHRLQTLRKRGPLVASSIRSAFSAPRPFAVRWSHRAT